MNDVTVREAYYAAKGRLEQAGVEDAAFDAGCLLEKDTGIPRARLPLLPERGEVERPGLRALRRDVERRAAGEPLQYILGEWEFFGRRFFVGPGVLIPRPETELLVLTAVGFLKECAKPPRVLELCAGSGCAMISIAGEVPACRAVGLELSDAAAVWCRRNIRRHGAGERVKLRKGDMLDSAAPARLGGRFDCIVCNPPYIPTGEIPALQREVRREPPMALDGGADGLRFYRAFAAWLPLLAAGGLAAFEVGAGQAPEVAGLLRGWGMEAVEIRRDLADIGRVVAGRRPARFAGESDCFCRRNPI